MQHCIKGLTRVPHNLVAWKMKRQANSSLHYLPLPESIGLYTPNHGLFHFPEEGHGPTVKTAKTNTDYLSLFTAQVLRTEKTEDSI